MLMPLVLLPISFYWHIIGNIFSLCSELCDFGQRAWLKGLIKSTLIMVGMPCWCFITFCYFALRVILFVTSKIVLPYLNIYL